MSEKLKAQQRENELERLASELEMRVLNQESTKVSEEEAPVNRCHLEIPSCNFIIYNM